MRTARRVVRGEELRAPVLSVDDAVRIAVGGAVVHEVAGHGPLRDVTHEMVEVPRTSGYDHPSVRLERDRRGFARDARGHDPVTGKGRVERAIRVVAGDREQSIPA